MTRVVLGERMYYRRREGRRPVEALNALNAVFVLCALRAARRRRPVRTALWTALAMAAKLSFVAFVARYYESSRERYPEDVPRFDRA